ncbi:SDR family oxidoreductase [Hwangdonia lutea]|uniref:SDR family NAD(P)-dependent oxidoreductase n=1 Tax=Hwangdonia lutea TaxID=3075823 RepID=A0AA97ENU5_9FLAO|nr:SDR family NAD(P)-dependent oxidoreductase [Hwangdonia sp. SCSIO 19198]WOD44802.1 SDR family NAD(P)-dependent oxidoreductase [Hwangdonia sp. SCSIO 19198]
MNLKSKIAIITGASKGLGAAISSALISNDTLVYGLARNADLLNNLKNQLGKRFVPVVMDISNQNTLNSWVEKTFSKTHTPDILINNAGSGYFGKIDALTSAQWHSMINTNINGLFYMTSQIVPLMKQNKNTCHIVNIGSILGKTTRSEGAAYCLTKYGVQGFSEALFKELRSDKIKVSCVNPGSIATDFFKDSGIQKHNQMMHPKDVADIIVNLLKTPDNMLIDEITLRPLIPKPKH